MDCGATFSIAITAGVSLSLSTGEWETQKSWPLLLYSVPLFHMIRQAMGKPMTWHQSSVCILAGVVCFLPARLSFAVLCCAQSCPILCDTKVAHQTPLSMGILQARTLEWVAMPFSRGSSQPRN